MKQKKQPDWEPNYDYVEQWELILGDMLAGMQRCDTDYDEEFDAVLQFSEELRKL